MNQSNQFARLSDESRKSKSRNRITLLLLFSLRVAKYLSRYASTLTYRYGFLSFGKTSKIEWPILITPQYIRIGENVFIGRNSRMQGVTRYEGTDFSPDIAIEDNVSIQQNLHLTCASHIIICKNTAIAANVTITDIDHPYEDIELPPERQALRVSAVVVGEDCKIYNNAVLLPGTILGRHSVVAANSVVIGKKYPDYSIIAGAPATIKKRYNPEFNKWMKTDENGDFMFRRIGHE